MKQGLLKLSFALGINLILVSGFVFAYPLDGAKETGIIRLEGSTAGQFKKIKGVRKLTVGSKLKTDQLKLHLQDKPDFVLPENDPEFSEEIRKLLGDDAEHYSVAVLDISNPDKPRFIQHNALLKSNPGSVGKLVVAASLFQVLADVYPDDIEARKKILRNSQITADKFILKTPRRADHHKVPFWLADKNIMVNRKIKYGDTASMWTYLDWMLSASSNAATSMLQKHMMLLDHFGKQYPVSIEEGDNYFKETPHKELSAQLVRIMQGSLTRNGIDVTQFRQGGFFSWTGKMKVPGTSSYVNSLEMLKFLLQLEKGKIVDPFSSLEIKRLIYMTKKRIRYSSSPALYNSAVYYKSGSLYSCRPSSCGSRRKYKGSTYNHMNSVAIVEHSAGVGDLVYLVGLTSNVLKKNSAVAHQTFATQVHEIIERFHQQSYKKQYTLTIDTIPVKARVRVMNIKGRFNQGSSLSEGDYLIKIKKRGYQQIYQWITLDSDKVIPMTLVPK